jgi:hypothetical protein
MAFSYVNLCALCSQKLWNKLQKIVNLLLGFNVNGDCDRSIPPSNLNNQQVIHLLPTEMCVIITTSSITEGFAKKGIQLGRRLL